MRREKNPINQQCKDVSEDIQFHRKRLGWNLREMCSKCYYVELTEAGYPDAESDKKNEKKFYDKYKKLFNRKSWDEGRANSTTLASLERLRGLIRRTNEYPYRLGRIRRARFNVEEMEKMREVSEELERTLQDRDSEACE